MLRDSFKLMVVTGLLCGALVADQEIDVYTLDSPIVIDGALDEAVWSKEPQFPDFRPLRAGSDNAEGIHSKGWVAVDDEAIYIAAYCYEPNMVMLITNGKKHDDPVWQDDCIEIFLDPAGDRVGFAQIVVSAAGVVMDGYVENRGSPLDLSWDANVQAAAKLHDDGWSLEVRIPFSRMPIRNPRANWHAHLARYRAHTRENYTSLEGPISGNHDVEHFAVVKGIVIPEMVVTVTDYSFGEGFIGLNEAFINLRNWSDSARKVEVVRYWDDGVGSETETLELAPRGTATMENVWELTDEDRGRSRYAEIKHEGRTLRKLQALLDAVPEIFADHGQYAYYLPENEPTLFNIPVNLTKLSRENARVYWTLTKADGEEVASGQSDLSGPEANLRFYWTFAEEGLYTLGLKLADDRKEWREFSRPIRFVRSVWEP